MSGDHRYRPYDPPTQAWRSSRRWRPRTPRDWLLVAGGTAAGVVFVAGAMAGGAQVLGGAVTPSPSPSVRSSAVKTTHAKATRRARPARTGWPPAAVLVTKAKLGRDWPFRDGVTAGRVGCDARHPGAIVFTPSDGPASVQGKAFGVNGTALDAGYPDLPKSIWAPEPSFGAGVRKSVGPVHDLAPGGCQR